MALGPLPPTPRLGLDSYETGHWRETHGLLETQGRIVKNWHITYSLSVFLSFPFLFGLKLNLTPLWGHLLIDVFEIFHPAKSAGDAKRNVFSVWIVTPTVKRVLSHDGAYVR